MESFQILSKRLKVYISVHFGTNGLIIEKGPTCEIQVWAGRRVFSPWELLFFLLGPLTPKIQIFAFLILFFSSLKVSARGSSSLIAKKKIQKNPKSHRLIPILMIFPRSKSRIWDRTKLSRDRVNPIPQLNSQSLRLRHTEKITHYYQTILSLKFSNCRSQLMATFSYKL